MLILMEELDAEDFIEQRSKLEFKTKPKNDFCHASQQPLLSAATLQ